MIETEIQRMYKRIPRSVCKQGCTICCHDMIQVADEESLRMGGYKWNGKCNHLTETGCAIHENRAFICRLFGTSEIMKCGGCVPEYFLTKEETENLVKEYTKIKDDKTIL